MKNKMIIILLIEINFKIDYSFENSIINSLATDLKHTKILKFSSYTFLK